MKNMPTWGSSSSTGVRSKVTSSKSPGDILWGLTPILGPNFAGILPVPKAIAGTLLCAAFKGFSSILLSKLSCGMLAVYSYGKKKKNSVTGKSMGHCLIVI